MADEGSTVSHLLRSTAVGNERYEKVLFILNGCFVLLNELVAQHAGERGASMESTFVWSPRFSSMRVHTTFAPLI